MGGGTAAPMPIRDYTVVNEPSAPLQVVAIKLGCVWNSDKWEFNPRLPFVSIDVQYEERFKGYNIDVTTSSGNAAHIFEHIDSFPSNGLINKLMLLSE